MDFYVWLQHICPQAGPAARNAAGVGPVGSRRRDTRGDADSPGCRACETRLPTNTKTPASPGDAGAMKTGRCVFPGEARPASTANRVRTMGCVVPRAVVLIRLTRFRSMLCLGRNLITVFQGVNTFAQLFSTGRHGGMAAARADGGGDASSPEVAGSPCRQPHEKKHRENASFFCGRRARRASKRRRRTPSATIVGGPGGLNAG